MFHFGMTGRFHVKGEDAIELETGPRLIRRSGRLVSQKRNHHGRWCAVVHDEPAPVWTYPSFGRSIEQGTNRQAGFDPFLAMPSPKALRSWS